MISFVFRPKQLNSKMNKLVLLLGLFLVAVAAMPLEEGKLLYFLNKTLQVFNEDIQSKMR